MSWRIPRRFVAPLVACSFAGAASVVGGACKWGAAGPQPVLVDGTYVLTDAGGHNLPAFYVDSAGRTLRVFADTIIFHLVDQTYEEHASIAITPPGGVEPPAAPVTVARRGYTLADANNFILPVTPYRGSVRGAPGVSMTMNLSLAIIPWHYDHR